MRSISKAYAAQRPGTGPGAANKQSAAAPRYWHDWAQRYSWRERAESWDEHLDRESRRAQVEARRRMQRRHERLLRLEFHKLVEASRTVEWTGLTPEQLIRYTEALLRMERLVHGQPITIERHEHIGAKAGPIQIISARTPSEPSPELMANVLKILGECGAFDGAKDSDRQQPPGEAIA
jgi:hypothetical protein